MNARRHVLAIVGLLLSSACFAVTSEAEFAEAPIVVEERAVEVLEPAPVPPKPAPDPAAGGIPEGGSIVLEDDADALLTLWISNQSFAITPVEIAVEVNGQVIVSDWFPVEDQHLVVRYDVHTGPGEYRLTLVGAGGEARQSLVVLVEEEPRHVTVSFWADPEPPAFTTRVTADPPGFD